MTFLLRWLFLSVVPALLAAYAVWWSDARREPWKPVVGTFFLGVVFAVPAFYIQEKASSWTGLDVRTSVAGDAGALLFQLALVSPMRELAKVAAAWPAFRSRHFDEPFDGVVYAATAALGFAVYDSGWHLHRHPAGGAWLVRILLALPAHVFFASLWGYALGRSRQREAPRRALPDDLARGDARSRPLRALRVWPRHGRPGRARPHAPRDGRGLVARGSRSSRPRRSLLAGPLLRFVVRWPPLGHELSPPTSSRPSLRAVRDALQRADAPIMGRWIVLGTLVTLGAMITGLSASIAFGHYAHVNFAAVNEHDLSTTAPVALLGAGLLAAFPVSGFLVARASGLPTLLEPALAAALAIAATLVLLGLAAPIAMVFALAFSPIAFALACAGAWVGRVLR